jgi:hypothetical protein
MLAWNEGSVFIYLHLRRLSENPLDRMDVKLLDRIDGFPVDCPIKFVMSGSRRMVPGVPSRLLPPGLDTDIAVTPASTARLASSSLVTP